MPANPIAQPTEIAPSAMGIRRNIERPGGKGSGISFVIQYKIRLCRGLVAAGCVCVPTTPDRQAKYERQDTEQQVMSNKMWGGRFSERPDAIMEEINVSIDVDRHLYAQDIAASKAHAAML